MTRSERLNKPGNSWLSPYQTQSNCECLKPAHGSETACDKVRGREGNSPDRRLRSRNAAKCKMRCGYKDSQEVGLEAAIPLKSA